MQRNFKATQGVTLLEIMLVLAIAAMVIVMSIRYYQNASYSQSANTIQDELGNVTAAAENIAQAPGTYSGVSTSAVRTIAGSKNMVTPYGASSAIVITSASQSTYSVQVAAIPAPVCLNVASKLQASPRIGSSAACSGTTGNVNLTYTYDATK